MAIFPIISTNQASLTPERVRAIAAWSQEAGEFLYEDETAIDQISRNGVPIPLDIHADLDPFLQDDRQVLQHAHVTEEKVRLTQKTAAAPVAAAAAFHRRRDASLRESKRREALLKGKEGSRRRQRWENSM